MIRFFKFRHWVVKWSKRFVRRAPLSLSLAAVISCVVTYVALSKASSLDDKSYRVLPLIYLDLGLLLALLVVISKRLMELWREHKQGLAGSRLHIKLVLLFSAIAVTPAILVAVFAALFFNVGVTAWFSEPVKAALNESRSVAEAYLQDHQKAIRHDAATIVATLRPDVPMLIHHPETFSDVLTRVVEGYGLNEAIVFNRNQDIVGRSYLTFALEFEKISMDDFKRAQQGELVLRISDKGDRVRALVRLDRVTETYLYLGKIIDQKVLRHLNQTKGAVSEYHRLEDQRTGLHLTFIAFFVLVAMILLLAAIWIGLSLAYFLMQPVRQLITAAESVRQGDWSVSIEDIPNDHELGHLAEAFNRMIAQVYFQRRELMEKNKELEHGQQLIQSVLASVSAGILSVDERGTIDLINHRALELLSDDRSDHPNHLRDLSPELYQVVKTAIATVWGENDMHFDVNGTPLFHQDSLDSSLPKSDEHNSFARAYAPFFHQMTIERKGRNCILQVCIVPEMRLVSGHPKNFVITFDDVTSLVMAQKKAAWSDVARRIAHEIKNPLTPIQLSAERLKRRYLKQIEQDPDTFQACIDTIIRQVGHIGTLVSEFSSFARMPEPHFQAENIVKLSEQTLFLQQSAHKDVQFHVDAPAHPLFMMCDVQHMSQVLTNLFQNSLDAMEESSSKNLSLNIKKMNKNIVISIEDSGPGFPLQNRERLLEPYVTTREKGTGLGLAIVSKIVEDHNGTLELGQSETWGGAAVCLTFLALEHDTSFSSVDKN